MHVYGTVLEMMERDVYHVESGLNLKTSMAAIIYQLPHPVLVLTRTTFTHNATVVTDIYTVISGSTLEDWKKSLEESDSMLWMPGPVVIDGRNPS